MFRLAGRRVSSRSPSPRDFASRRHAPCWLALSVLALLGFAAGCGMSSGTASKTAEGAVAEDHPDEAEHHVPEHRPADYAQLTEQLRVRWTELCEPTGDSRAADAEARRRELGEIIDWIPEIAAESDLRQQEWEDVRRLGRELAQAFERNRSAAAEGTDAARPLPTSPEIDRLLDALDAYRAAARRDEPAVP